MDVLILSSLALDTLPGASNRAAAFILNTLLTPMQGLVTGGVFLAVMRSAFRSLGNRKTLKDAMVHMAKPIGYTVVIASALNWIVWFGGNIGRNAGNLGGFLNTMRFQITLVRIPMTAFFISLATIILIGTFIAIYLSPDHLTRREHYRTGFALIAICVAVGAAPWIGEWAFRLGAG